LAVCGTQGIQNLPVCIRSQDSGHFEEIPFYGVLIAKKGDKHWYPFLEVYDQTKEIGYQSNVPYALWIDSGRLLLSVVLI
jgi:hypothetical protein